MNIRLASLATLLPLSVLAGCYNVDIPTGAQIICATNADCPEDFQCRPELGLCVETSANDNVAPSVVDVVIDPPLARPTTHTTVTFNVSEPLLVAPTVELVLDGGRRELAPVALADAPATRFAASYVAIGDEGDGDHELRALLIDTAGNAAADVSIGRIAFDFTPPTLNDVTVTPAIVREGTEVVLTVRSTEPLGSTSTAAIVDGSAFIPDVSGADPLVTTFRLNPAVGIDAEGDASIVVDVSDLAGNRAQRVLDSVVRIDFTAPGVDGGAVVAHPVVTDGQVALVSFRASEAVSDAVVELVPAAGGPALPMTLDGNSGRDLSFRREVSVDDADGLYRVHLVRLVDIAGNVGEPTDLQNDLGVGVATVSIDARAPTFVAAPTSSPSVVSRQPGRDLVSVVFTLDEEADVAVQIGDLDAPCSSIGAPPSIAFTCERGVGVDDVDGTYGVSVTAVDGAGNTAFASAAAVTFDFTPPSIVVGLVPDRQARGGEIISVSAVADEVIDPASVVFNNGGLAFAAPVTSGRASTTSFSVPAGLQGEFAVSFVAADLGGNVAAAPVVQTVRIDGVAPTLTSFALSKPRVAPNEAFTLTLQASEALPAPPTVTFANGDLVGGQPVVNAMTLVSGPSSSNDYVFSGTGPASGQNQFYTITVIMTDVAGNPGADSPAVVIVDNAPPSLAGFDIAPAGARAGDTVRVVVTANETLASPPTIVARNGAASFTLSPTSTAAGALSYVFTMPIDGTTAQGSWTFDAFSLVDEAGNSGVIAADAQRTFVVDSRAPTIGAVALSKDRLRAGTSVDLTFTTSEAVNAPRVVIGSTPMTLVTNTANTAFRFRYTAVGDEAEGLEGITISVSDLSGNVGVAGANIEFDFTTPSLVTTSATPAVAKAGDLLTYTVTADEALAQPPTLTVGGNGAVPLTLQGGTEFVFTYAVTGAEPQGPRTVLVALTDVAGNSSSGLVGDGFSLDTNIPAITSLTVTPARASRVAGHNIVTSTFTLSEDVGARLQVTVGGAPATCSNVGLNFTCTYTVSATDTAGAKSVVVQATDGGGNVGFQSATVEFDFTAPALVSTNVTPAIAKPGSTITYSVSANETLAATPTLAVGGGPLTFTASGAGTNFAYTHLVVAGDAAGARTTTVTMTDVAGNTSAALAGSGFSIDVTTPSITSLVAAPASVSRLAGSNVVTTTFTLSESVGSGLSVTVGGAPATCTSSGLNFTCSYTVQAADTAGTKSVTVQATDAAGNVGFSSTAVEFDFTAPTLVGAPTVTPALAKPGDVVTYTVAVNEPLTAAPTLTTSGASPVTFVFSAGTAFTYQYTVTGAETSGARTTSLTMTDRAGNATTVAGAGFALDTTVPVVSGITVTPRVSRQAGRNVVTTAFTLSENVGAGLVVTVGGAPALCTNTGLNFTCTNTVQAADTAGTKSVSVRATDAAGNVGFGSGSVEYDFTGATATTTVTPSIARPGSTVVYTVTASEPLSVTPTLTIGGGALAFSSSGSGTTFTFTRAITAADVEGARTVSIGLTDSVGNTSTVVGTGFAIDISTPSISSLVVGPAQVSRVAGRNVVTATFTLSENVGAGLSVTVGGNATSCSNSGLNFTCTYTVLAGDTEGAKSVAVQAIDAAGNVGFQSSSVTFDFTPPALVSVPTVSPAIARVGDVITYTAAVSEPLASTPTLSVSAPALGFSFAANTTFTYQYTVTAADQSGTRTTTLAMTDRAGNTATVTGAGLSLDTSAPTISSLTLSKAVVSRQSPFNATTIAFNAADNLGTPTVVVTVGANPVTCTNVASAFSCVYTPLVSDVDGAAIVLITATDAGGNVTSANTTLGFDFTAPSVVGNAAVVLTPAATNPNRSPTLVTTGTRVSVAFTMDERLGATPTVTTTTTPSLSFAAAVSTNPSFTFEHTLSTVPAQGTIPVQVVGADAVGNSRTTTLTLSAPGFVIDSIAPAVPAVTTADRITYTRTPWGDSAGGNGFTVVGSTGAIENNAVAVIYNQANVSGGVELARATASSTGAFSVALDGLDRTTVFVTAIDAAGNSSDAAAGTAGVQASLVKDVTWVATMGRKVAGSFVENPHLFETRLEVERRPDQADSQEVGVTLVGTIGGGQTTTTGAPSWREARSASVNLSFQPRLVYDAELGLTFLPGGPTGMRAWNGTRWEDVRVKDPEGDGNPELANNNYEMVYDAARGVTVLFGGNPSSGDTWTWDGNSWRRVFDADESGTIAPAPRTQFAMTYDEASQRVLLFGGTLAIAQGTDCEFDQGFCSNDFWAWDGESWTNETTGNEPSPRSFPMMAFDADSGLTVVFGGKDESGILGDTFVWDGGDWSPVSIPLAQRPPARASARAVHDSSFGGIVMFGGEGTSGSLGDQWFFDGGSWSPVTVIDPERDGNPAARFGFGLTLDVARNEYVLFGGEGATLSTCSDDNLSCNDTWRGLSNSWVRAGPNNSATTRPQPRVNAAHTFDRVRGRALMFGGTSASTADLVACASSGVCGDLQEWDGARFISRAQSGTAPARRTNAAMTFDETNNVAILFGGSANALCDGTGTFTCDGIYLLNGATGAWSRPLPGTRPSARRSASFVYDASRNRAVLFGGVLSTGVRSAETWEWNGSNQTWTLKCTGGACGATLPVAREAAAMAFDRTRSRVMLWGDSGGADSNSVYEFNGTTWTRITPTDPEGDGNPTPRRGATLVYDEARQRMVLFGEDPATDDSVLWEWNSATSSWRDLSTTSSPTDDGKPAPRSGHSMVYDPFHKEVLVFGGFAFGAFDTWRLDTGSAQRPAHFFHVDFGAAQAGAAAVVNVGVTWVAGGTGFPAGSAQNGVTAYGLVRGAKVPVVFGNSSSAAPGSISANLGSAAQFFSSTKELIFAVEPTAANGTGATRGAITTDYVEARVRYRL